MIDRLVEAWESFLDLYVRTNIQPANGPVSAVIWGEADVQLLVAHLLMSSPGGNLRVHQEVTGFGDHDAVGLVVTDPGPWLNEENPPWPAFTPVSAVDLAVEIRVVRSGDDHALVRESALKLREILAERLAREAAVCVLDKLAAPDRGFYENCEDAFGITILRAFDEDLALIARPPPRRTRGPQPPGV